MSIDLERLSGGLLPAFTGVQSLVLEEFDLIGNDPRSDAFGRIFAAMFANLQELDIITDPDDSHDFAPHLGLFRHLRKHRII